MSDGYEVVWSGGEGLVGGLDRDYAAMPQWDGWEPIWLPTSPLTTPWWELMPFASPDPDVYVRTSLERRSGRKRGAQRILNDWCVEYTGVMSRQGSHR